MEINRINLESRNFNALPPGGQMALEMDAISKDPRLKALIGEEMDYILEKTEGGYLVRTALNRYELVNFKIEVRYLTPDNCGPMPFELIFPDCIAL